MPLVPVAWSSLAPLVSSSAPARPAVRNGVRRHGKIRGFGVAADIHVGGGIERDGHRFVAARSAQEGGPQPRAGGVELGHKSVAHRIGAIADGCAPRILRLEHARARGKIGRLGAARDIGVAAAIDRYAVADVGRAAAQIRGIDEAVASGIQFGHEGVAVRNQPGLDRLAGERVGLVTFAGTAFLQSPLSADYEILREFLPMLGPDYLPEGGTTAIPRPVSAPAPPSKVA